MNTVKITLAMREKINRMKELADNSLFLDNKFFDQFNLDGVRNHIYCLKSTGYMSRIYGNPKTFKSLERAGLITRIPADFVKGTSSYYKLN